MEHVQFTVSRTWNHLSVSDTRNGAHNGSRTIGRGKKSRWSLGLTILGLDDVYLLEQLRRNDAGISTRVMTLRRIRVFMTTHLRTLKQ